jgi:hypothetical protein
MAKKFVTEEGLSQVVDAIVEAIQRVAAKQITAESVVNVVDSKLNEAIDTKLADYVKTEGLDNKIAEALGEADIQAVKDKLSNVPSSNERGGVVA